AGSAPRSRAGAGVGPRRSARGPDRAASDKRRLGLATACADGQIGRADTAARTLAQEALHAPLLERVEGDAGEHAARAQQPPRERQRAVELSELVVDGD